VYKIMQLPIELINVEKNPRLNVNNLSELTSSMQQNGLLVPISVFIMNDEYFVRFGHRRLEAAKILGWETIDAIIDATPESNAELLRQQYAENQHRVGATYFDNANIVSDMKALGMKQKDIAEQLVMSEAAVSLYLSMLAASPKIRAAVNDGRLSPSAAEEVIALPEEEQEEIAQAVISAKTVTAVKKLVAMHKMEGAGGKVKQMVLGEYTPENPLELMTVAMLERVAHELLSIQEDVIVDPQVGKQARDLVNSIRKMLSGVISNIKE